MASSPSSGPRFSLLAFLLAVTVVCLAVALWNTSTRLNSAESELRKLRNEAGYLTIDDRSKLHAVAIDTGEPNTWRWRMFVPKGVRYEWNIACEDIPMHSPPARPAASAVSNEPYWDTETEVLVTARLRKADEETWTLSVTSKVGDSNDQLGGTTLRIPREKIEWMGNTPSVDGQVLGARGTAVRDPDGPIILLQKRGRVIDPPDGNYDVPLPGFMVWLSKW